MASLPDREKHEYYGKMDSDSSGKKAEERMVHVKHVATLADKITGMLKKHARSLKVKFTNQNNKSLIEAMKQVIERSELVHLTCMSEQMNMSSPETLMDLLATAVVLHRTGLVPAWNEKRKTKIGAYVHYNKLTGNLDQNPVNNFLLYPDNGMYDEEITETPALLLYARYNIADYPSSQAGNQHDKVYSTSVEDYSNIHDAMWYRLGSKNQRHVTCKPIRGCFFAVPLAKPNKKYSSTVGRFKDVIQDLSSYVCSGVNALEIVERILSSCNNEEVAEYIEEMVSREEEIDDEGNVVGKRVITDVDDNRVEMLAKVLEIEEMLVYDSVKIMLKVVLLKQGPGDELYEQAFAEVKLETEADDQDQVDYESLVLDVLDKKNIFDDDQQDSNADDSGNDLSDDDQQSATGEDAADVNTEETPLLLHHRNGKRKENRIRLRNMRK